MLSINGHWLADSGFDLAHYRGLAIPAHPRREQMQRRLALVANAHMYLTLQRYSAAMEWSWVNAGVNGDATGAHYSVKHPGPLAITRLPVSLNDNGLTDRETAGGANRYPPPGFS
ncbi:hypothetical protein [Pseudomonas typographi]|uniref:hypothetical protein n=1 Tax=Pseudomonas typographi TaxID=2715964 RepID=UPI001685768F|nr:hypothetical protein [Pseudomonas typographi]MBD1586873.1 hypothetical protein [Pseudomonas typographi]